MFIVEGKVDFLPSETTELNILDLLSSEENSCLSICTSNQCSIETGCAAYNFLLSCKSKLRVKRVFVEMVIDLLYALSKFINGFPQHLSLKWTFKVISSIFLQ